MAVRYIRTPLRFSSLHTESNSFISAGRCVLYAHRFAIYPVPPSSRPCTCIPIGHGAGRRRSFACLQPPSSSFAPCPFFPWDVCPRRCFLEARRSAALAQRTVELLQRVSLWVPKDRSWSSGSFGKVQGLVSVPVDG